MRTSPMTETALESTCQATLLHASRSRDEDWIANSVATRKAWLGMMGLGEQEIAENCEHCLPTYLDKELRQYNAMLEIQELHG